jgi:hypothetical protein
LASRDSKVSTLCAGASLDGRDDPYHDPMKAFAAANNLSFLSTKGNHIKAIMVHGGESVEGIASFLDAA